MDRPQLMPVSVVLAAVLAFLLGTSVPLPLAWAQTCEFHSGFRTLRDLLPDLVGECLENERTTVEGTQQRTTGGLLVWRQADNWTAFTDGYRTWSISPQGLQQQSNAASFGWQRTTDDGGLGLGTVHLPGNDRIRLGIHPDGGHFVIYTYNTATDSYDPVLQLTNAPFQSTGHRIGIPHFWRKIFLQGGYEFLEFRIRGKFPNNEGQGVGGFIYLSKEDRLTLWTENWRGQGFATRSQSELDVGVLATTRLAIGAGSQYEDVPITVSDAHVVFDGSTVASMTQPNISVDDSVSALTLSGGPNADNGAGLALYGSESTESPGGLTLTTPDQTGSAATRVEVSSGADAAITLHAPAIAAGGLSVPEGRYLQIASIDDAAPPSADCDSDEERGRLSIAGVQHRLYVCRGAARGWDYVLLSD